MVFGQALSALFVMAAAQAAPPPDEDVLHLLQLAVATNEDTAQAFATVTSAIRNCEEARVIGRMLPAEIVENRSVPLSILPPPVRELLRDLPTGQATPVFGQEQSTMKVLVICARRSDANDADSAI